MARSAPARARARAVAWPIPAEAPVTSAVWPARVGCISLLTRILTLVRFGELFGIFGQRVEPDLFAPPVHVGFVLDRRGQKLAVLLLELGAVNLLLALTDEHAIGQ